MNNKISQRITQKTNSTIGKIKNFAKKSKSKLFGQVYNCPLSSFVKLLIPNNEPMPPIL